MTSEAPGSVAHPYFPLVAGWVWGYATSQSHSELELPGVRSTLTVVSLRREHGRLIASLSDQVEGQAQGTSYELVATPDGILPGVGKAIKRLLAYQR